MAKQYTIRQIQKIIPISNSTIIKQIHQNNLTYQKIDDVYHVNQAGLDFLKQKYLGGNSHYRPEDLKSTLQVCALLKIKNNQLYRLIAKLKIKPIKFNYKIYSYYTDDMIEQLKQEITPKPEANNMYVGTYLNYVGDIVIDPDSMSIDISQTEILLLTHLVTNLNRVKGLNKHINQYTVAEKNQIFKKAGANIIKITEQNSDDLLQTLANA